MKERIILKPPFRGKNSNTGRKQQLQGNPERRKVIVKDYRALKEIKRILRIKTNVADIELVLLPGEIVFAMFGPNHRIKKRISRKNALRIITNLVAWNEFLKKHKG